MKILFLDIDGVLWTIRHQKELREKYGEGEEVVKLRVWEKFDPIAISNLNKIMEQISDLRIVISSSWRLLHSLEWLQEHFASQGFIYSDRIVEVTPHLGHDFERGDEIKKWLEEFDFPAAIKGFVILDDDSDMGSLKDTSHFIQTDVKTGLTEEIANKVIKMFKEDRK